MLDTRLALGGVRVSNPKACEPPISRPPRAQRCTTRAEPGRTRTVATRRVTGFPGANVVNAVGTREPPPDAGMQPTSGLKVGVARARPAYVPRKTTERDVEIPGLTGLPSAPRNAMSIARTLNRASRPPATWPFGHVTCHSMRTRGTAVDAGTTTHGPDTGTHTCRPSHSCAAPAGPAPTSAAAVAAITAPSAAATLTEPA